MPCDPTDNQIPLILLEILRCLFLFLFCVRGYHHSSSFLGNHSLLISQNLREFKSSSYSPHDFLSLVFNFSGSHSPIIIIVNRQEGERVMKSPTAGRGQTSTVLHYLTLDLIHLRKPKISTIYQWFNCDFAFNASAVMFNCGSHSQPILKVGQIHIL